MFARVGIFTFDDGDDVIGVDVGAGPCVEDASLVLDVVIRLRLNVATAIEGATG